MREVGWFRTKGRKRGDLCVGACLPDRHCERSEAIQALSADAVWIASSQGLLAMTRRGLVGWAKERSDVPTVSLDRKKCVGTLRFAHPTVGTYAALKPATAFTSRYSSMP